MIMRLFLVFGLFLLGGTAYFIVVETPPTVQATPAFGEIERLRDKGLLPEHAMSENEAIEHDIFGVPPEDEAMIEAAMQNMDMGGMDMSGGGEMDMDMDGDGVPDMRASDMNMAETEGDAMDMTGGDGAMEMAEHDEASEEGAEHGEDSAEEAERLMAGRMAGLIITQDGAFDREIELSMSEWTFSDLEIDAKPRERIRFTLRNDGNIVHEFMFMGMAQMQGVNYRARRADWNLLEHEALFEKSLVLPGEEITFVAEVLQPGAWMFMCMLPYHMQMGMMGQLATEGMAMEM